MTAGTVRIAFLGTPDVAVPTLETLAEIVEIAVVVTQPDRPAGRSGRPVPPAVKVAATAMGLAVAQPERSTEIESILSGHGPLDAGVLVAFGQLIRPGALAIPRRGIVNIHFSLLPRWRGAAPVQRALMAGDTRTGVTLMQLDEGLDTGAVLAMRSTAIGAHENAGSLLDRLSHIGARLAGQLIPSHAAGRMVPIPQMGDATSAAKIGPTDCVIDWTRPATAIADQVRGLAPRPGALTTFSGDRLKVLEAAIVDGSAPPGVFVDAISVGTGSGIIRLVLVQPAGKRAMDANSWANGLRVRPDRLGTDTSSEGRDA
jgi:methionyl-tRNA formyltransferase